MECIVGFIFLVVVVALAMAVSNGLSGVSEPLNRAFYHLAQRYNGSSRAGGMSVPPEARFPYGASRVVVAFEGGWFAARNVVIRMNYPEPHFWCQIFPERQLGRAPSGAVDVEIGHPEFDHQFTLHGRNAQELRQFLSAGVQLELQKLRHLCGGSPMHLLIGGGVLELRKGFPNDRPDLLQAITQCVLDLYDQAQLTLAVGIEFGESPVAPSQEAKCPVCLEPLGGMVVQCRRCRTPHHLECWNYNGCCGRYACRESEYSTPTPGQFPPH